MTFIIFLPFCALVNIFIAQESRCVRCSGQGHTAKNSTIYRRSQRPKFAVNALEEAGNEDIGHTVGSEVP